MPQQSAGAAAKNRPSCQQTIHFQWEQWFSDTIGGRGPTLHDVIMQIPYSRKIRQTFLEEFLTKMTTIKKWWLKCLNRRDLLNAHQKLKTTAAI